MIEKINILSLDGYTTFDAESEVLTIPYEDIELLAKKINEIIDVINKLTKKE